MRVSSRTPYIILITITSAANTVAFDTKIWQKPIQLYSMYLFAEASILLAIAHVGLLWIRWSIYVGLTAAILLLLIQIWKIYLPKAEQQKWLFTYETGQIGRLFKIFFAGTRGYYFFFKLNIWRVQISREYPDFLIPEKYQWHSST